MYGASAASSAVAILPQTEPGNDQPSAPRAEGSTPAWAGIRLAFASLANLIVEAVRLEQPVVATGMNTVMRTLGGSLGSQIGASIMAGTVVATSSPP